MVKTRRSILAALASIPAWSLMGQAALASEAEYPVRPVHIIVPGSPGTAMDRVARYIANELSQAWSVPIYVENKVGASGLIGTDYVAKAAPNGEVLLFTAAVHYVTPWVMPVPYDVQRDFTPVARTSAGSLVLLVPANSPYQTMQELLQDMRARPGELTYGSAGEASTTNLAMVLFNDMANTTARHIPYAGAAQALVDLAGGQLDMSFQSTSSSVSMVKSGKLRVLAVGGAKRSDVFPDAPTVAEAGVPGYDMPIWLGMFAPAGTPDSIVRKLSSAIVEMPSKPSFMEMLASQASYLDIMDSAQMRAVEPAEIAKWKRVVELSRKS